MTHRQTVSPRFASPYFMTDDPDRIRGAITRHVSHWRQQRLPGYLGGPFEDRTGGLISFRAENVERAEQAVDGDPFIREGLLQAYWLKQWTPERVDDTSPTKLQALHRGGV